MLVQSHRHTPADILYWQEYEDGDFASLAPSTKRIEQAGKDISDFLSSRWPVYAGVSWGKDSVVVAHLLWRFARHVPLVHLRPTNHNPDCDVVRDIYFSCFSGQSYQEIAVDYSGIDRVRLSREQLDKATDERWYAAIDSISIGGDSGGREKCQRRIIGIRADESGGRKIRMFRWGVASKNSLAVIGFWRTDEVFAYLAKECLPVHPAYACLGGGRWERERIRVAEIGDTNGTGNGRREWEREYYGDELRRIEKASRSVRRL